MTRTELPWTATSDGFIGAPSDQMNDGFYIAQVYGPDQGDNIDFISRAVNSHDALVSALDRLLRETLHEDNLLRNGALKAAISQACLALAQAQAKGDAS